MALVFKKDFRKEASAKVTPDGKKVPIDEKDVAKT